MMNPNAEMTMNLIGLILIAALSGGIVAVSLRLRVGGSSGRFGLPGEQLPREEDRLRRGDTRRVVSESVWS